MKLDYLILKILDKFIYFIRSTIFTIGIIILLLLYNSTNVYCSESPERDCCDPIRRIIPNPEPTKPTLHIPTTLSSTSSIIPTGRSGSHIKTASAILNCILARQLCFEDPSCSAILEIIPRVCGPVPVACSTVTVTKCQAALRTLQAFPFFRPTCLCKEPNIDPDCNYFRDFLFDHPCGFVLKKEKDPYPIDALPTCNHALSVCQQERKCIKLFEDFKLHCKVRENKCRMEDRDLCLESWTNLRLSPMFGCICPNNHMKRRCDRIFSMVNHNPCVDELPINDPIFDLAKYSNYTKKNQNKIYPKIPNYLYPAKYIPLALASHRPDTTDINFFHGTNLEHNINNHNNNNNNNNNYNNYNNNNNNNNQYNNKQQNNNDNDNIAVKKFLMHLHNSNAIINHTNSDSHNYDYSDGYSDEFYRSIAREMGIDENLHLRLLDENMGTVETPLIASSSAYYPHLLSNVIYPYNITGFQGLHQNGNTITTNTNSNYIVDENGSNSVTGGGGTHHHSINEKDSLLSNEETSLKVPYQSTCHIAMESCRSESSCLTSLQNMLLHCEPHRCNRNACMDSVQKFYRSSNEDISLDSAFCLCKKSQQYSRYDVCMVAQEKLHPTCAQRPPENLNQPTSNGVVYHPLPACHTVAELCKEENECRLRLELFEQSCAIDSVTKKCAGKTNSCRLSMLGIFGTTLRSACTCQGVDAHQMYECLGWQKLIWLNPCAVESQRDFHLKRLAELGLLTTSTTTTTTTTTTPAPTTTRRTTTTTATTTTTTTPPPPPIRHISKPFKPIIRQTEPPIESNYIDETIPETLVQKGNIRPNGINTSVHEEHLAVLLTSETTTQIDTTSTTTTTEPTTTSVPTRYCVVQKPHQNDQYIAEGQSQRILLDDLDCSELCTCSQGAEPLALACHVLCVPLAPCRTALAYYSHAAPAYQAFRGRCLCYSGKFICMRPPPGEYTLPGGVFLLLGYSSTDEALLRPHTNLGVQDAVRSLHHYLQKHINNETSCTLTLFNMTDENVILSARLPLDTKINPLELLRREKEKCTPILDKLAHQINSQQKELTGHPLLSIFKMAEVQVIWPEFNNSKQLNNFYTSSNFILTTLFLFIYSLLQNSNQLIYLR